MKNDIAEKSVQKPKASRLAIASLVLAILSILFPPTAIIAIILAIVSILKIRKNVGRLKGTGYITGAMIASALSIALWTMAFMVWTIDADPIPNDYTIADLRSAPLHRIVPPRMSFLNLLLTKKASTVTMHQL